MADEAAQYVTVVLERAVRRASAGFREHCRHGARETHADKRRAEVCLAHIPISNRLSGSLAHRRRELRQRERLVAGEFVDGTGGSPLQQSQCCRLRIIRSARRRKTSAARAADDRAVRYMPLRNMTNGSPLSRNIFSVARCSAAKLSSDVSPQDARVSDERHFGPRCRIDDVLMVRSTLTEDAAR